MEVSSNSADTENQNEKIERVERPTQKARHERATLRGREAAKIAKKPHAIFQRQDWKATTSPAGSRPAATESNT
jgi:hypothetical protein